MKGQNNSVNCVGPVEASVEPEVESENTDPVPIPYVPREEKSGGCHLKKLMMTSYLKNG
jgi:hypothetical protein